MSPPNAISPYKAGQLLAGKYRLERLIGKGGMGVVYAAQHELLHQRVAIKLLLAHASEDADAVTRFMNEARAAARIPSEHVVRVLDVGLLDGASGQPFLVMEYLEGKDLARVLDERGHVTPREAVEYVLDAIEAVAQAHALGIVHRDLKPSNLFLAERADGARSVKVLDFGIAKALGAGASAQVTTQGLLGSPSYMAPEYVRSAKSFEPRSDMWALGVILYELLSGELPFYGDNVGETLVAILEKTPIPLLTIAPEIPPGLAVVVDRCLRRKVRERFADLAELAEALAPYAAKRSVSIARIRTTMNVLRERPVQAPAREGVRSAGADDPTAAAPPGAHTHDSWSGAPPTVRRPRRSTRALGLTLVAGSVVAAGLVILLALVLRAAPASVAPAAALETIAPLPPSALVDAPSPSSPPSAMPSSPSSAVSATSSAQRRPPPARRAPRVSAPAPLPPPGPVLTRDRH